jgi:hypothetical protein
MTTYALLTIEMVVRLEEDQLPQVREKALEHFAEGVEELAAEGKADDIVELLAVALDPTDLLGWLDFPSSGTSVGSYRIDDSLPEDLRQRVPAFNDTRRRLPNGEVAS